MRKAEMMSADHEDEMQKDPALQPSAAGVVRRLSVIRSGGVIPGIRTAPYYIVVAERREYPPS